MKVVLPPGAAHKSRIVSPGCAPSSAAARAACWGPGRKTSRRGNLPATPAADAISIQRPDFPPASRAGRNRIRHFPRASGQANRRRFIGGTCSPCRCSVRRDVAHGVRSKFQRVDPRKGFRRRVVPFEQLRASFPRRSVSASARPAIRDATSRAPGWEIFKSARSFLVSSGSRK